MLTADHAEQRNSTAEYTDHAKNRIRGTGMSAANQTKAAPRIRRDSRLIARSNWAELTRRTDAHRGSCRAEKFNRGVRGSREESNPRHRNERGPSDESRSAYSA